MTRPFGYRGRVTSPRPRRAVCVLSASALVIAGLVGCTPAPEPEPTKTELFASDEEAFAAAEGTYRAYLAATDEIDLSDPHTFEIALDWLAGDAETHERETLSQMHAEGLAKSGTTTLRAFTPVGFDGSSGVIVANLCLDVSDVDLRDAAGTSVVPPDRPGQQALSVTFGEGQTATGLVITASATIEDFKCDEPS